VGLCRIAQRALQDLGRVVGEAWHALKEREGVRMASVQDVGRKPSTTSAHGLGH
jgi:hypothetical protein